MNWMREVMRALRMIDRTASSRSDESSGTTHAPANGTERENLSRWSGLRASPLKCAM